MNLKTLLCIMAIVVTTGATVATGILVALSQFSLQVPIYYPATPSQTRQSSLPTNEQPTSSPQLSVTPEEAVNHYFLLLSSYKFGQAQKYLSSDWDVSPEQFRENWSKYQQGSLHVSEIGKKARLREYRVGIEFSWRGRLKDGQAYGDSWRCILRPSGASYVFERCE